MPSACRGFVSATGERPIRKSTIDYFTPIYQPFSEYAVVRELLKRPEEATAEVGQKYGLSNLISAVYENSSTYFHVVTPGTFHTVMNYLGMGTNLKCSGSRHSEILLEAGLITSGCLKSVLKGKAYAKALFCIKTVSEAMERLLME